MPYIKITANTPIPLEKKEAIKEKLGKNVSLIGKSEGWLMVDFCENSPLYFKGTNAPAAMVSVDLYGSAGAGAYGEMTGAITNMLTEKLDIKPDRVFVKYAEYKYWGYNGGNF